MARSSSSRSFAWALLLPGLAVLAGPVARADALAAVQVLRAGGCGGVFPRVQPLRRNAGLDRAAALWAEGRTLSAAAAESGYQLQSAAGVHVSGPDSSLLETIRRTSCRAVMGAALHEVGLYRRGSDSWLVLASGGPELPAAAGDLPQASRAAPASSRTPTAPAAAPLLAKRALELVNDARARGARCGGRVFAPAPPISLSPTLAGVALGHAADMAQHDYFEHQDLVGHSPADRVRAVGYREKLVGENIAYGPESVEEAVQGWLDSADHCENIMDPRFAEMGIASASGRSSRRGLYWVQVLAEPRA
ncbi:MAG: CAP domain-containing protein [Gammaproteobacteria bacterium]|nr:CAP domain-containing protein [Gammaproteobacteria bacterium]